MKVAEVTGKPISKELTRERGRLVDAIADSSAHLHGKRFAIYGDPDLCYGLAAFLLELGAEPITVLATNGGKLWEEKMKALFASSPFGKNCKCYPGKDLWHMRSLLFTEPVDFLIGNTYGKYLERDTGTPLIRIGFPIFDRHHYHRYPVWGYQGGLNVLVWLLDKVFEEIDRNTNVPSPSRTTASTSFADREIFRRAASVFGPAERQEHEPSRSGRSPRRCDTCAEWKRDGCRRRCE